MNKTLKLTCEKQEDLHLTPTTNVKVKNLFEVYVSKRKKKKEKGWTKNHHAWTDFIICLSWMYFPVWHDEMSLLWQHKFMFVFNKKMDDSPQVIYYTRVYGLHPILVSSLYFVPNIVSPHRFPSFVYMKSC